MIIENTTTPCFRPSLPFSLPHPLPSLSLFQTRQQTVDSQFFFVGRGLLGWPHGFFLQFWFFFFFWAVRGLHMRGKRSYETKFFSCLAVVRCSPHTGNGAIHAVRGSSWRFQAAFMLYSPFFVPQRMPRMDVLHGVHLFFCPFSAFFLSIVNDHSFHPVLFSLPAIWTFSSFFCPFLCAVDAFLPAFLTRLQCVGSFAEVISFLYFYSVFFCLVLSCFVILFSGCLFCFCFHFCSSVL